MEIDADGLSIRDTYALMTGIVVPRPIAWVSTMDDKGHVNLAPFSYFNAVGSDPPMLTLSIAARGDGSDKDTLRLIKTTGFLCVNLAEEGDAVRLNDTSAELPAEVSEARHFGIDTAPCFKIPGVRIASSRAALECRLVEVHVYGRKHKVNLVVAEVLHLFVDDALLQRGVPGLHINPAAVQPIARLGGANYAALGRRFSLHRP